MRHSNRKMLAKRPNLTTVEEINGRLVRLWFWNEHESSLCGKCLAIAMRLGEGQ